MLNIVFCVLVIVLAEFHTFCLRFQLSFHFTIPYFVNEGENSKLEMYRKILREDDFSPSLCGCGWLVLLVWLEFLCPCVLSLPRILFYFYEKILETKSSQTVRVEKIFPGKHDELVLMRDGNVDKAGFF